MVGQGRKPKRTKFESIEGGLRIKEGSVTCDVLKTGIVNVYSKKNIGVGVDYKENAVYVRDVDTPFAIFPKKKGFELEWLDGSCGKKGGGGKSKGAHRNSPRYEEVCKAVLKALEDGSEKKLGKLVAETGISREQLRPHIYKMVDENKLKPKGKGQARKYQLP